MAVKIAVPLLFVHAGGELRHLDDRVPHPHYALCQIYFHSLSIQRWNHGSRVTPFVKTTPVIRYVVLPRNEKYTVLGKVHAKASDVR